MSIRDRTAEFASACSTIASRNPSISVGNPARFRSNSNSSKLYAQKLLLNDNGKVSSRSEFAIMAASIAREIQGTTVKLEKLGKLAKRRTLFDDRPIEITELTEVIKQDIQSLNRQIASLQSYVKSRNLAQSKQAEDHNDSVLVSLQSSLAKTSKGFADVLEVRTANMKAQKDRREQFSITNLSTPPPMSNSPLYYPNKSSNPNFSSSSPASSSNADTFVSIDMSTGQMSQQQLVVMESQEQYIDSRATAIESIESTIAELGQIFQQLGQLVSQQREHVLRIDANVDDIETNISSAQKELLKYYNNISSNRRLMLKMFAVVLAFYMIFVFVL